MAQAEIDGWTPLCWAVCPLESGTCYPMRSERKDHVKTVRILLQHGASPTTEFHRGEEILTPLDLAQRCDAGNKIISLLREHLDPESQSFSEPISKHIRKYTTHHGICNLCLNVCCLVLLFRKIANPSLLISVCHLTH